MVLKAATQKFATATEREHASKGIDQYAYNAVLRPETKIRDFQLEGALNSVTPEGKNTLLHLAAGVGNLPFIQQLLKLKGELLRATNAQGNTALHLAAQGDFRRVVQYLLQQEGSGVEQVNELNETALFKAYESGDLATVKALFDAGRRVQGKRQWTGEPV